MMKDAIMRAPRPPQSLTRLQIKRELARRGLWEAVKAAIAADPETAEDWSLAVEIRIDDPMFRALAASVDLDIDEFAREAAWRTA